MTPIEILKRVKDRTQKPITFEESLFFLGVLMGKLKIATGALEYYLNCPDEAEARIALEDIHETKIGVH